MLSIEAFTVIFFFFFVAVRSPIRAVEIDRDRFDLLKSNIKKSAAGSAATSGRVFFFNADFLIFLEEQMKRLREKRPVVFLDPPWGGVEYKNQV